MAKIQILIYNKNSWFMDFIGSLIKKLRDKGHDMTFIDNYEKTSDSNICFFLSCCKLVPKEYLTKSKYNIVVHSSDLPKGRGWCPLTWQILEGKNKITTTLFESTEGMDSGDIYLQNTMKLRGDEFIDELREKQARKVIELATKFVELYS